MIDYITKKTKTFLTKNLLTIKIQKRTFMRVINAAAKQSAVKATKHSSLTDMQVRNYASAHGGRLKFKTNPANAAKTNQSTASNDNADLLKLDLSGKHQVGVLAVCAQNNCKNTNCAVGTAETNPCGISGDDHQKPIAENEKVFEKAKIVVELNGAITHKIPQGFEGTEISTKDILGQDVPQLIVHENGVTPLNVKDLSENQKTTGYLQSTDITGKLINNASPDSVMNTLNKAPSTLLAKNDTPKDENF